MYHCHTLLYFIGHQHDLFNVIQKMPPLPAFTHEFEESESPEKALVVKANLILADLREQDTSSVIQALTTWKSSETELILMADSHQIPDLTEELCHVSDIWTLPMTEAQLKFHFLRWQESYKLRKDYWQTSQYLEATINHVPNLIWYKDKDGIHEKVNDSFCDTVNKTKAQVEGQRHAYIWNVEHDDPACIESERIVMEQRETRVSEEIIQTGEGTKLLTTYKSPLYDLDGSVMGTVGVAIDSTLEHAYAQEIVEKNQALEKLFTTMDCGIMCHTLDGSRIVSINQAALKILGYESQEALMADGFHTIASSVLDEDKRRLWESIHSLKNPGDNVNVEYCVQHENGEILYVMGNIKLIEENGELYYQRYMLNCTAQKLQEEMEQSENQRHQMELIHALSIDYTLVCFFDLDTEIGRSLRVTECTNNILDSIFSQELILTECMERYIEKCVYEEDQEALRQALTPEMLEKELLHKSVCHMNYRTIGCGEIRYFQMKAVRAGKWDNSHGVVIGFRSIDEETRDEREKNALLEDALSQANLANKAKSTFLSNMSHDIRTPMNAIIGFTALAISHIDRKEQVAEYLKKIMTSGNHLLSLINDVLDMSRIESGKIHLEEQPCSLPDILHGLRNIIQGDIHAKQLKLSMDAVDIQNEEICCDRLRLNQVLLNLLSNAVKYTNAGGMVSMKVIEKSDAPAGYANYEFHVKDTGIGMSEEFISHIFEPFERERNSTISGIQGTGLGMAITKKIVDMMGGSIEIKSKQGVGTECIVSFTFLLNSEPQEPQTIPELKDIRKAPRTGRILLVDDNELNQEIATAILEEAGFSIETAENGQIAVDMLKSSEHGHYQLILMDVQMPVMNGYEATMEIRRLADPSLASIPILAMTANAFEEDKQEALSCGMNGHIAKPINIEKLMETLDEILAKDE